MNVTRIYNASQMQVSTHIYMYVIYIFNSLLHNEQRLYFYTTNIIYQTVMLIQQHLGNTFISFIIYLWINMNMLLLNLLHILLWYKIVLFFWRILTQNESAHTLYSVHQSPHGFELTLETWT